MTISQASRFFTTPQQLRMAHAIEQGDAKAIGQLIREHVVGPNDFGVVPVADQNEERPISFLTYAVMVKNRAAIEALLASGANVNFRTPDGWSAMAEAARSPDETLLPLLIGKGGDVNMKDNASRPITFVSYMSQHLKNMYLLLDRGADINAKDSMDETLLMTMADLNDYEHMLDLMRRGGDPKLTSGANKVSVAWVVQESAGNLTSEREQERHRVIRALEQRAIRFPVPRPPVYRWDPKQHKFVLPVTAK